MSDEQEDGPDPFEAQMNRGAEMRRLRELAEAAEREAAETPDDSFSGQDKSDPETGSLQYSSFLSHQSYFDDLKHVDYPSITYDVRLPPPTSEPGPPSSQVTIRQEKALGKGGICWDAAFILGEFMAARVAASPNPTSRTPLSFLELGAGTGLTSIFLARALHHAAIASSITTTDLPELLPLLSSNCSSNPPSPTPTASRCSLTPAVLTWGEDDAKFSSSAFDFVIGADIVASLYERARPHMC
ncbi:hypothetical protein TeGR_g3178 [Tetraparma gracilis]|uniref:Methyltransferase-domain-containing protein n=1 Tax=Tetraparma gracilis TaxID=2962635 RepID=A0ABQ6M9M1_9STRA|nr:hypothetical protein TeGR_g3178 [Tetraparma gracilis]